MIQLSTATKNALYNYGQSVCAECFTFYLPSGTARWTSYGTNVTYGGNTWLAGAVGIHRGRASRKVGTGVDTMEVILAGTISIGGAPLTQAALSRAFNGVRCTHHRVYFDVPGGTALEAVVVFDGTIFGPEPGSLETKLTVRSPMARASDAKGFRIIGTNCPFVVYGSECGATVQQTTATVASGSTAVAVNLASVPATAAIGSLLTFTSGTLNGVAMRIRSVSGSTVTMERPVSAAPASGVTCMIRRGCDHTPTGCNLLGNIIRFGGATYAPPIDFMAENV